MNKKLFAYEIEGILLLLYIQIGNTARMKCPI